MRPAAFAAFGAEVDEPSRLLDDVEVVLDDEHGCCRDRERCKTSRSFRNVVEMQAVVGSRGCRGCGRSGVSKRLAASLIALGFAPKRVVAAFRG